MVYFALIGFAVFWIFIVSTLAVAAGWVELRRAFPDHRERALYSARAQSGMLGRVRYSALVTIQVCPSGLRVSICRLFSPLTRPILVPWSQIRATRERAWFLPAVKLTFGSPEISHMHISGLLMDGLVRRSRGVWPPSEALSFSRAYCLGAIFRDAAILTFVLGVFPHIGHGLPTPLTPAIVLDWIGAPAGFAGMVAAARFIVWMLP
jgi:hypothetical protein